MSEHSAESFSQAAEVGQMPTFDEFLQNYDLRTAMIEVEGYQIPLGAALAMEKNSEPGIGCPAAQESHPKHAEYAASRLGWIAVKLEESGNLRTEDRFIVQVHQQNKLQNEGKGSPPKADGVDESQNKVQQRPKLQLETHAVVPEVRTDVPDVLKIENTVEEPSTIVINSQDVARQTSSHDQEIERMVAEIPSFKEDIVAPPTAVLTRGTNTIAKSRIQTMFNSYNVSPAPANVVTLASLPEQRHHAQDIMPTAQETHEVITFNYALEPPVTAELIDLTDDFSTEYFSEYRTLPGDQDIVIELPALKNQNFIVIDAEELPAPHEYSAAPAVLASRELLVAVDDEQQSEPLPAIIVEVTQAIERLPEERQSAIEAIVVKLKEKIEHLVDHDAMVGAFEEAVNGVETTEQIVAKIDELCKQLLTELDIEPSSEVIQQLKEHFVEAHRLRLNAETDVEKLGTHERKLFRQIAQDNVHDSPWQALHGLLGMLMLSHVRSSSLLAE